MVSSASCCKSGPFGPRLEISKLCFINVFYFAFFHLCFHITPNLNFLFPSALYHTPFDMCVVLCFISLWRIKTLWQACRLPIQLPYKTLIPPPKYRLQQEMVKAFILKAFLIFMCSSSTKRNRILFYSSYNMNGPGQPHITCLVKRLFSYFNSHRTHGGHKGWCLMWTCNSTWAIWHFNKSIGLPGQTQGQNYLWNDLC